MPKPHPKNCWMQGFGANKIRPQFLGCPAYNTVTIPICYHGFHTKKTYLIISILTPNHRSTLQKLFPSSRSKTHTDLFFNRAKVV